MVIQCHIKLIFILYFSYFSACKSLTIKKLPYQLTVETSDSVCRTNIQYKKLSNKKEVRIMHELSLNPHACNVTNPNVLYLKVYFHGRHTMYLLFRERLGEGVWGCEGADILPQQDYARVQQLYSSVYPYLEMRTSHTNLHLLHSVRRGGHNMIVSHVTEVCRVSHLPT